MRRTPYSVSCTLAAITLIVAPLSLPSVAGEDTAPEEALATVERLATASGADDLAVARFRSLLDQLAKKYSADRVTIASQTITTINFMREKGVRETPRSIMEGLNVTRLPSSVKYGDALAIYATARVAGMSHADAMAGLESFVNTVHGLD